MPHAPKNELSRSLKGRHLTMISIGGIIGAGLFVSSSAAIAPPGVDANVLAHVPSQLLQTLSKRAKPGLRFRIVGRDVHKHGNAPYARAHGHKTPIVNPMLVFLTVFGLSVEDLSEAEALNRLGRKERMIDPNLYPKLKGTAGVFRLTPARVENHIIVTRALAGQSDRIEVKLKPADYADYLVHNALR